ncbi:MAG: beta strand repeat-containing protein, partial [Ferruginibacter sp.]
MKNLFTNLKLKNTIKLLLSLFFVFAFIINVNATDRPAIDANTITFHNSSLNACGILDPDITGNTATITNATWHTIGDPGVGNCAVLKYMWQYSVDGGVSWVDIGSLNTSDINFPSSWTYTNTSGVLKNILIRRVVYATCTDPSFSEFTSWSTPITFHVYPPFTAAITSQTNLLCYGNTNGAATVTISGGTAYFNYYWGTSPAQSTLTSLLYTNTATNLPAGTYSVTVTDNFACNATTTVTITQPDPISFSVSSTPVTCTSNGSISLTVSGGTGTYTYAWTKDGGTIGTSTSTLTNLGTGTYVATVTDANNCTASVTQFLSAPPSITINLSGQINVSCNGLSNGAITTSASGGTGTLTYKWVDITHNPGGTYSTSPSPVNFMASYYMLTVSDAHCSKTATLTITEPAVLGLASTGNNDLTCYQNHSGSIALDVTGGTATYSYSWYKDNLVFPAGTASATLVTLDAGTYSVTVTDSKGCTLTRTIVINEPSLLTATQTHTAVLCNGGSTGSMTVTASGGTASYTYSLDGGTYTSTFTFSTLAYGTHTVTVRDNKGCEVVVSAFIDQPSVITTSGATQSTIACHGGTATVTINGASGGTSPYSYIFNGSAPQSSNVFPGILAGANLPYSVTDAHSCSAASGTLTVTEPSVITIGTATQTTIACHGGSATVTITATGGTSTLTYSLIGYSSNTNGIFSGVSAGAHDYSVTDVNACSAATGTITVVQPSVITVTNATQGNIACNGGTTSVTIIGATGGTGALAYTFNNVGPQAGNVFTGVLAGTDLIYSVTDANLCAAATGTLTVTEPTLLTVNVSKTDISCYNLNNGTITATATGGTPSLSYAWTLNGSTYSPTTSSLSNLAAGSYTVTVSDANNCQKTATTTIINPADITINLSGQINVSCNGLSNGA